MKIFETAQIANIDKYTIENEPIHSIDLMERASETISTHILNLNLQSKTVVVFCGPGNNGGDGLAVARMLATEKFQVSVLILDFGLGLKGDSIINFERLTSIPNVQVSFIQSENDIPTIPQDAFVVDALFGSGLTRPLTGLAAAVVKHINSSQSKVLAIDIPSGLMGEDNSSNEYEHIIQADITLTFQFPKLSFLFPENSKFVGHLELKEIGLHQQAIDEAPSPFFFLDRNEISGMLKPRNKFAHKGHFGHALLIAGAYGKMGAAVLAAKACLRAGVGLITVHVPRHGVNILQTSVPEAMLDIDDSDLMYTDVSNLSAFNAIGIGPGIGLKVNSQKGLHKLIQTAKMPLVIDADAINILGLNKTWLEHLPVNSILTPHPKEFERIAGASSTGFERMQRAVAFAKKYNVYLVVKGANSMVVCPNGNIWFNSTGNPGMATAGSGDALTGIILGFLAQGYDSCTAAKLGVYLHGLAGDIAAHQHCETSLIASDIISNLSDAIRISL